MKKIALLICAGAFALVSCGGHTLCPAYSSVEKMKDNNTCMAVMPKKVVQS